MQFNGGRRQAAVTCCTLAVLVLGSLPALVWADDSLPSASPAAQLVRQALESEAAGDNDARGDCLRQALAADPDYPPAHWQSGEVLKGNHWVAVDETSRDQVVTSRMEKYRQLLSNTSNTVHDQYKLADFCAKIGLKDEEQVHLANVLRLAPNSPIAKKRLGRAADQVRHSWLAQREVFEQWLHRFAPLRKHGDPARRETALAELAKVRDPTAIPALEATTVTGTADVGQFVVATLARMPGQQASVSLARHAVFAPHPEVRQAAIKQLEPRSVYSYVPTLLAGLQMPVAVRYETFFLYDGRPAHRLSLFQEGQNASRAFVSEGAPSVNVFVDAPRPQRAAATVVRSRPQAATARVVPDQTLAADSSLAEQAEQYNMTHAQLNDRISAALQATGQNFAADPKAWWEWWATYNELYSSAEKPVSYMTRSEIAPITYSVRYSSCFVAGTSVATLAGPMPIEKIRVGNIVLSQDVESGKLAYKQVTATTVGPKLPLVVVRAGGETIRCTYGHVFWVSGLGWQMAKQLQPGQWLHTVHGPIVIDGVEKTGEASCHNLIVSDFNTYFVTDRQVLVHDINVHDFTMATVPGLIDPE
jgi:hypothetical protein